MKPAANTFPVDDAGTLVCNVDTLVDTRMLIQSNSGGGKSFAVRRILEQTHGKVQHLVLDPEGEFSSLRERFDYVHAAAVDGDCIAHPRSAALLAERLLKLGVSAILDLYELQAHERVRFVRLFLEALINAPKSLWHPALVVIDEAHTFCPQHGSAESASAVIDLCSRGRKRGFSALCATQRIAKLHKDAAAELNNKLIGRTTLDIDLARAADELGFTKSSWATLKDLPAGNFFASGPAFSARGVTPVHVGSVRTTHPKAGSRIAFVAPPPTSAIHALLPQLADLPAEAEKRERTIEELEEKVRTLQREPEQLRAQIVTLEAEAATRLPAWQGLAFTELRETNVLRCTSKGGYNQALDEWTPLEWAGAAAGELGEMANLVKKMRRGEDVPVEDVADEIADVIIYLDLLAALLKVDLGAAVVAKFNKTSKKRGIQILLGADPPRDDAVIAAEYAMEALHPTHARELHGLAAGWAPMDPRSPRGKLSGIDVMLERERRSKGGSAEPSLRGGARRMLTNLVAMGPLTKVQLATLSVMAPSSGTFSTYISNLRTGGLIEEAGDTYVATKSGRALIGPVSPPSTPQELRNLWGSKLRGGARGMLDVLIERGRTGIERDSLAHTVGMAPTSGTFSTYLSNLISNGLATKSRDGLVVISDVFRKR